MLSQCVGILGIFLLISGALMNHKTSRNNSIATTSNPVADLFSRFHQSDYKATLEWAEVLRVDKRYADYQLHTFKYNRTCAATNVTFTLKIEVGNDLEFICQAYKFASNEYRLFPIRLQINFCHGMARNVAGSAEFKKNGNLLCPLIKGKHYYYHNWTPDESMLPPFIPSGKYMLQNQFFHGSKELVVTNYYIKVSRLLDKK